MLNGCSIVKPLNLQGCIRDRNNPAFEVSLLAFLQFDALHRRGEDWGLGGVLLTDLLTDLSLLLQVLELAQLAAGFGNNLSGTYEK